MEGGEVAKMRAADVRVAGGLKMGELWRDVTEMMREHPVLWVPVLVAEFLGYWVKVGTNALVRAEVLSQMQYHSAVGGAMRQPLSQSAVRNATMVAIPLSWGSNFLRLLLYASALVATAALVRAFAMRERRPGAEVLPALRTRSWGVVELAVRALVVFVVAAALVGALAPYLAAHGHAKMLRSPWFSLGLGFAVLLLVAATIMRPTLRVLARRPPGATPVADGQRMAFVLLAISVALSVFVDSNAGALMRVPLGARVPLEVIGTLVVGLPYAVMFVGLGVLARRVAAESEVEV